MYSDCVASPFPVTSANTAAGVVQVRPVCDPLSATVHACAEVRLCVTVITYSDSRYGPSSSSSGMSCSKYT